jgi:hypothetical protein
MADAAPRRTGDRRPVRGGLRGASAEAREQIGGFYLIDVPTLDDAVGWARRIPQLPGDCIEVRATT